MEGGAGRQGVLAGMTLGDVLGKDKDVPLRVNHRTLLDIIRQEEPNCRAYENLIDHHQNKKGWKFFKDRRLRPRCSLDSHVWAAGVPVPPINVGFHRDLVSTSNRMVMGAGSESNQRPPLAQLLRDQSVRVVEQVQENDDSGEMTWAGRGQVQWLNQNRSEQVQEDDDPGEVPWAGRGQVQSLNQNRSEQVQEEDDSGEVTWAGRGQAQSLNQNRSKKVHKDDVSGEVPWAGRSQVQSLNQNRSVRVFEQVQEGDDSGEVPWAGRGRVQSLNQNRSVNVFEQVQEDDDSGEVPWVGRGQVQSLNHYLSPLGSSHQNDVDHGDSLHIEHVLVSAIPAPIGNSMSSMLTHNLPRIPSPGQPDEPVRSVRLSEALAAEREHMQVAVSLTEATGSAQYEEEVTETNNHNEERDDIGAEAANEPQQVRMSLMDLLEETDSRRIGWSSCSGDVKDYPDDGNEYVEEEGSNFVEQNCCVCMVRHKGSAFIPCGHTFCRLCSRELWVNRGNCPICNGFILEILDIF